MTKIANHARVFIRIRAEKDGLTEEQVAELTEVAEGLAEAHGRVIVQFRDTLSAYKIIAFCRAAQKERTQ